MYQQKSQTIDLSYTQKLGPSSHSEDLEGNTQVIEETLEEAEEADNDGQPAAIQGEGTLTDRQIEEQIPEIDGQGQVGATSFHSKRKDSFEDIPEAKDAEKSDGIKENI